MGISDAYIGDVSVYLTVKTLASNYPAEMSQEMLCGPLQWNVLDSNNDLKGSGTGEIVTLHTLNGVDSGYIGIDCILRGKASVLKFDTGALIRIEFLPVIESEPNSFSRNCFIYHGRTENDIARLIQDHHMRFCHSSKSETSHSPLVSPPFSHLN